LRISRVERDEENRGFAMVGGRCGLVDLLLVEKGTLFTTKVVSLRLRLDYPGHRFAGTEIIENDARTIFE
jgi:hypothetical protein